MLVAVQPTNLQSHDVTNISVAVTWEIIGSNIGCNGALLNSFRVRHRPVGNSRHKRGTARRTSTTLNNLLPFTNYTVTVATMDPSGSNSLSGALLFQTLPGGKAIDIQLYGIDCSFCFDLVPSAPVNVTTSTDKSEPTQLLIMWQVLKYKMLMHYYWTHCCDYL